MAIDERARHQLFQKLEEKLGPKEATTLMEMLPPVGWADVATKRDVDALAVATKRDLDALAVATKGDLDALEERLDLRIDALEERLDLRIDALGDRFDARLEVRLGEALRQQTRTFMFFTSTLMLTLVGIVLGTR